MPKDNRVTFKRHSRSQWFYSYQQYKSCRQFPIMKLESYKDSRSQGIMSYSEKCKMELAFNNQKDRDTRQQKRHWCIEQSFGLCGRGRGWDDLGEWHWNMLNVIYEMSRQSRFNARYWMLGAGALGQPRGMVRGGRREEGSGWGTRVYPWRIHVDVWQNQYNIVK